MLFNHACAWLTSSTPLISSTPTLSSADRRAFDVEQRARHGGAHQREVAKLAGGRPDIGADVEDDAFGFNSRPQRGDRGTLDARHRPQNEFRHRHEGAGVAGRHSDGSLALVNGVDGEPHARAFAAAERLARLFGHRNDGVGVNDARALSQPRRVGELGLDLGFVAEKKKVQLRVALERQSRSRNDHLGAMVPAHGVKRYCPRL